MNVEEKRVALELEKLRDKIPLISRRPTMDLSDCSVCKGYQGYSAYLSCDGRIYEFTIPLKGDTQAVKDALRMAVAGFNTFLDREAFGNGGVCPTCGTCPTCGAKTK
jgi:hypothetical protein